LIRRLGPADYRAMPWRNGLGTTTELFVHPAGGSLETGFLLRVSRAPVVADGPFSAFPGIDRSLLLLEGGGLALDHGPHGAQVLARPLEPVRFSGDWPTTGRLLGGACLDFGVMSRREGCSHELRVVVPGPGGAPLPPGDLRLVYCARGAATVAGEGLEAGACLVLEGGAAQAAGDADLVVVAATWDGRNSRG